jgi:hypothetical protein
MLIKPFVRDLVWENSVVYPEKLNVLSRRRIIMAMYRKAA